MGGKFTYLTMTELFGFIGAILALALGLLKAEADRRSDRVKLNTKLAGIEAAAAAAQEAIEQRAIEQIMQQQKTFAEQNRTLTARLNEQANHIQSLMQSRAKMEAHLKGRISKLEDSIAEKDTQITTIETAQAAEKLRMSERITILEKRVDEMINALRIKDAAIKALEGKNHQLETAVTTYKAKEARWIGDRAGMEGRIKKLEAERDTLAARLAKQETRIEKLETSTGNIPIVKDEKAKETSNENADDSGT